VGKGELDGKAIDEFVTKDAKDKLIEETNMRKEGIISDYEIDIVRKDKQIRKIKVHASPVLSSTGDFEWSVSIIYDITQDVLEKEREEFLNTLLRHDVKNRIGIISSYLTILELTDMDETQLSYINKAMNSLTKADELLEEIHQLLLIGHEEITDLKLKRIINEAVGVHEGVLDNEEIQMEYPIDDVLIRGGGLLKELFSNIIENSIKHANCKKIRVKTREKENQIIVNIEDDGKGISEEMKEIFFESNLKKRNQKGLGLGTLLISTICKSYGGNIRLIEGELGGLAYELTFVKST
jgi:K+-sensing histidine kinase KdpD